MSRRTTLAVLAGVTLLVGLGCVGEAWRSTRMDPRLVPAAATQPTVPRFRAAPFPSSPVAAAPGAVATSPLPLSPLREKGEAAPVSVTVPAIGLAADIVPVALDRDGGMEIPLPNLAGWYRLGPAPGAVGPAVLVGHVDTRSGGAVFYRLTAAQVGDMVMVNRADRSTARFVVTAITIVKKAAFPLDAVFGPTSGPSLRLITCTGPFDPASHHYLDSLIVWANLVD